MREDDFNESETEEWQLSLPFTLEDYGGIDAVYFDQAPYQTNTRIGYHFGAFYTPLGIQSIDSGYIRRILEGGSDLEDLRWEILTNPHLHPVIKENLISNLDSRIPK